MTSHKLLKPVAHPTIPFAVLAGVLGVLSVAAVVTIFGMLGGATTEQWAALTTNYLFVLGLSQWGVAFSAIMRVVKGKWGAPFNRIAEMATLSFIPVAFLIFLMIFMGGREHLLYWVTDTGHHSPWLSERGFLIRNLLGMGLFYIISIIYYRYSLAADDEAQPGTMTDKARITGGWVLVFFIVNYTFLAWDFGMMSIPHFHSTVYPLHIILGNMNGGTGFLLILYLLFHNQVAESDALTVERLRLLGILLTSFTLLWLYMFWAQFFVFWFGNLPHETGPMWKIMYEHYGTYFWIMMSCVFFIPFLASISAWVKKNLWAMLFLSVIVIVGVWLNRYLMIFPVISDDHQALSAPYEFALLLGLPALHFLLILIWARLRARPAASPAGATENG